MRIKVSMYLRQTEPKATSLMTEFRDKLRKRIQEYLKPPGSDEKKKPSKQVFFVSDYCEG